MPAGGKRKGAGRPKKEQTKVIRVPVGALEQIERVIELYKNKQTSSNNDDRDKDSNLAIQSNRKFRSKSDSYFPVLTPFELKCLRRWLFEEGFSLSQSSARKMTSSPVKCKRAFLKYVTLYFQKKSALSSPMALVAERYSVDD